MRPLFDADYSAIEARIVCWLAGQEDALDEYRQGIDRYKVMASLIYSIPVDQVNKHPQRFVGKTAILGCGFQMSANKFRASCLKMRYDLPPGLEDTAVAAFREKHKKVKQYWYDVEAAAQKAILHKNEIIRVSNNKAGPYKVPVFFCVKNITEIPFLLCKLPSGRRLAYPRPKLVPSPRFEGKMAIKFFGHIIGTQWGDVDTYGGKLVENCLSGETKVLSEWGWVRMDSIKRDDLVFDGVEFVRHQGVVSKGVQTTIAFHGLNVTPDHRFKTKDGEWKSAFRVKPEELYSESSANLGRGIKYESRKLVFDILDCGPRNQFAVMNPDGVILIAHNCTQAVAADIMCNGAQNAENADYGVMALIHDQALAYTAEGQTAEEFTSLLTKMPSWAEGLPIEAEGGLVPFYKKD